MERKIRILAAAADPSFVKMIEDSLKESGSGYDLEEVSSGRDCLEKLRKQKFDILLLDHDLPDGKGLDWLRRFSELEIGIPTIFITAKEIPPGHRSDEGRVFDYINRSAECASVSFCRSPGRRGYSLMVEKVRLQRN
jgi:CheY-like chemotaxis protein